MASFDIFAEAEVSCVDKVFEIAGELIFADAADCRRGVVVGRFARCAKEAVTKGTEDHTVTHEGLEFRGPLGELKFVKGEVDCVTKGRENASLCVKTLGEDAVNCEGHGS
jgi:hypothetical protein